MSYMVHAFIDPNYQTPLVYECPNRRAALSMVSTLKQHPDMQYIEAWKDEPDKCWLAPSGYQADWSRCKNYTNAFRVLDVCGCRENKTPVFEGWHKTVHHE